MHLHQQQSTAGLSDRLPGSCQATIIMKYLAETAGRCNRSYNYHLHHICI